MSSESQSDQSHQTPPLRRSFLTLRQLIMLAIAAIPATTGSLTTNDIAFVIFSFLYIHFLTKFSFPPLSPTLEPPVFRGNKILKYYVSIAGVIGLLLPTLYIFICMYRGEKEGAKAASPHLFLLACQVFMEGVTFSSKFSIPIRVFVPVFYNSKRIFSLVDWLRAEFSEIGDNKMRLYVGRGLAIVNMGLWCYNLFGFLLPVYLPKAFKKYYGNKAKD